VSSHSSADSLTQVDHYGGWIRMIGKADNERIVRIAERAARVGQGICQDARAQEGASA